ncbi:MAG: LacI family DNA-binding transcriptional regulator [Capsulimonadales bacterium]|nr:LacI family DNA-binding transcriptional regulator [Capsulimonadales bacterium]
MSKPRSVTIQDVARACGVSPTTVSLVLNNSSRRISAETRERVLRYVRETRYQPSALARGAAVKRLSTIGVLSGFGGSHYLHYSYYLQVLGGVMEYAQARQLNLLVLNENLWSGEMSELRLHIDGRCGGLLLIGPREKNQLLPALTERGIPFVVVGKEKEDQAFTCVDVDNRQGAKTVTEYLLRQGHRRIALFRGSLLGFFDDERYAGYRDALSEANLPFDPTLVFDSELSYSEYGGQDMARQMLRLPPRQRPTAIFCGSDQIAYGVLDVFREQGIRVPKDVSLIGFDDERKAAMTDPPLTTLRQPYETIGARASQLLIERIEGAESGVQDFLPGELVVRQSVRSLTVR